MFQYIQVQAIDMLMRQLHKLQELESKFQIYSRDLREREKGRRRKGRDGTELIFGGWSC